MKQTANEEDKKFDMFEGWEKEFKCDTCEFSKFNSNLMHLFNARQERYITILEKIALIINPDGGMCGKLYEELPEMIEEFTENKGDKAKLKAENSRLKAENQELALELIRLRGVKQ